MMNYSTSRVSAVDGLRCIAVLGVIFYHYLYRFSYPHFEVSYTPYIFAPSIMEYGFFGVQLFFVISGFVISQTLEKSQTFSVFMIKRFVRLWPSLVLCSIITFLSVKVFDPDQHFPIFHSKTIMDFVPGLTFTPASIWNWLLNQNNIEYIDTAYWSLFVEMLFYFFGGIIFFIKPRAFLNNWLLINLVLTVIRIISSPKLQFLFPESINDAFGWMYSLYLKLHVSYWVYFSLGIFFNTLYKKERPTLTSFIIMALLVILELYFLKGALSFIFLGIIALFVILVYRENWLAFLKLKIIVWIGLISYPLYLLHQNVGLILINQIVQFIDVRFLKILPFFVTLIMILLSSIIYNYYERPVIQLLKKALWKNE